MSDSKCHLHSKITLFLTLLWFFCLFWDTRAGQTPDRTARMRKVRVLTMNISPGPESLARTEPKHSRASTEFGYKGTTQLRAYSVSLLQLRDRHILQKISCKNVMCSRMYEWSDDMKASEWERKAYFPLVFPSLRYIHTPTPHSHSQGFQPKGYVGCVLLTVSVVLPRF